MTINNKITQIYREVGGAGPGAPTLIPGELVATDAGLLAINFNGSSATDTAPAIYCFDGAAWQLSGPGDISSQKVDLTTQGGANIVAAWTAWTAGGGTLPAADLVLATYGTPAATYLLTNKADPGIAASWTSLGSSTDFADAAGAEAGTEGAKAIAPDVLRVELARALAVDATKLATGMGASIDTASATAIDDEGKLVKLDSTGKIDPAFLTIKGTAYIGNVDVTTAPTPAAVGGDFVTVSASGSVGATWTGLTGQAVVLGDILMYDGTSWHHLVQPMDMTPYLLLAGGQMMGSIDMNGNSITKSVINGGTF